MGPASAAEPRNDAERRTLEPLDLDIFYPYGFQGREMIAVRAPHAMSEKAAGLVGRTLRMEGALYIILGVHRQISGPIAAQEPVGLEVRPCNSELLASSSFPISPSSATVRTSFIFSH